MRTVPLWLSVALVGLSVGCQTFRAPDAKVEAESRWNRTRARVKLQLAEQHYESGWFAEAARTARESLALDATQAAAYAVLIKSRLELGKPASAMHLLDAAEEAGVEAPDLHYLRGVVLEQREEYQAAAAEYAEAHRSDPESLDYLTALAECLVVLNRPAEALALLEDNRNRFDDDGAVATLAGHLAALNGDERAAATWYRRAADAQPVGRVVAEELARLLMGEGRFEDALAILSPLLVSAPFNDGLGSVRRAIATCRLALGNAASAQSAIAAYADAHPDDTLAQLLLAKAAIATNDVVTALRAVHQVESREPHRPELWLVRAAVQWKRGNLASAASDLYDVLQNNPHDVEAHCLLAEVLNAQGRAVAARTHFARAQEIDPAFEWAAKGLKSLKRAQGRDTEEPSARLTSAGADAPNLSPDP